MDEKLIRKVRNTRHVEGGNAFKLCRRRRHAKKEAEVILQVVAKVESRRIAVV